MLIVSAHVTHQTSTETDQTGMTQLNCETKLLSNVSSGIIIIDLLIQEWDWEGFCTVLDIELQRNNSNQKRPVDQSMKKFERNIGRKLPNAEPVSMVSRSSSDALGGQGGLLDV